MAEYTSAEQILRDLEDKQKWGDPWGSVWFDILIGYIDGHCDLEDFAKYAEAQGLARQDADEEVSG